MQRETELAAEGLANAREILAVDGVDGCFVAKRRIAQGFRFLTVMAETRMIRAGATHVLAALRG